MAQSLNIFVTAVVLLSACAPAQRVETADEPPSLHERMLGLWQVTDIRNLTKGEDQPHQREYHMYTAGHEMIVLAGPDRPKLAKSMSDMTAEEVISQQPVGAGFYSYTIEGNKVTRTNVVALSAFYEGRNVVGEIEIEGDTLIYRDDHSADGDLRRWTMKRIE